MADIDGVLSRTSECRKDAAITTGICSNSFDTSVNDGGTPALLGVFLEVAGRGSVAVGVTVDLRLVALHPEEI
jgi:hypothetical protein